MGRIKTIGEWLLLGLATILVLGLLFVDVGPRVFPYEALIVRSGSMTPTIPTGSLVLYKKAKASQLKVGDVIVFTSPNDPNEKITHRIYAIQGSGTSRYFETKGDANPVPDAWRVPATGSGWEEFWHAPGIGYALSWLQSSTARILLISIPAVVLGILMLWDLRKPRPRGRHARGARRALPDASSTAATMIEPTVVDSSRMPV
ncbi:MAG: signal peptidase I [Actinomycetota bacterium]|nr:signal peptidase I [Actinomycetota bacterium]